ncbi:complement component 1 Q subcomponent-binding protein, mitochondrial-like [Mytilus trossulus]|uniref:complement component 1 Q subcomponent-binding protein, mitochondrial-like n=1 Tax=Mytilus trossulus TaxID=6551 RepID=UPI003007456B
MASLIFRRSSLISSQVVKNCKSRQILGVTQTDANIRSISSLVAKTRELCHYRQHVQISSHLLQRKATKHCSNCSCGVHSKAEVEQGDLEFSKFLDEEIRQEKERTVPLVNTVKDWDVQKDDAEVTLSKSIGNEQIRLHFNINNMVDVSPPESKGEYEEGNQNNNADMVMAKPLFTVEIVKSSGKTLSMDCSYPEYEVEYEQEDNDDAFCITSVSMTGPQGEGEDNSYSVVAETMDETMYEMLMDMLHDRGIDDKFIGDLADYSTGYEQSKYIELLVDLKSFLDEK